MKTMLSLLLLAVLPSLAIAVPGQWVVQGQLSNGGAPIDGVHAATFKLYDAATEGTLLWSESISIVVERTVFSAVLGQVTPTSAATFNGQPRWLEVAIDDMTLAPRIAVGTSPYAFRAAQSDTAAFALNTAAGDNLWSTNGTDVWRPGGNVGLGTSAPSVRLDVSGSARITGETGIGADPIGGVPLRVGGFVRVDGGPAGSVRLMSSGANGILESLDNSGLMIQPSGGSVGIRTNDFAAQFNVGDNAAFGGQTLSLGSKTGSASERFNIQYSGSPPTAHLTAGSNVSLGLGTGDVNNRLHVTAAGDVGVGTTSPVTKLDVAGTGKFLWFVEVRNQGTAAPALAMINANGGRQYNINVGEVGGASTFSIVDETAGGLPRFLIDASGNVTIPYNLTVSGTKCRVVDSPEYGALYFNAIESARPIFTTSGRAKLEHGRARVAMDPKWMAGVTISPEHPLEVTSVVFYGPHGNWYARPNESGFELIDPLGGEAEFFWTVQAAQKGYEAVYLDQSNPTRTAAVR